VQAIPGFPRVVVSADGRGVVSHVGARLLADVAAVTGLVDAFDEVASGRRVRRSPHCPGRVLADVAVMIADGGEAIPDLAVLRDQPGLFGQVASPATCWRVLDSVDASALVELKQARAAVRERAWLLRGEAGRNLPAVVCGGGVQAGLVIDIDATLVTCHSEKEGMPQPTSMGTAITRCWPGWTTPERRWPGCCVPAMRPRTMPPTTPR
jgi:Transposase DDE domain group 1